MDSVTAISFYQSVQGDFGPIAIASASVLGALFGVAIGVLRALLGESLLS